MKRTRPPRAHERGSTPLRESPAHSPWFALPDGVAWAGLAIALLILALHVRTYVFLTDDAFISFRYVRNLVEGHGLVFNPGGERVEGYTNLLWVLLLAGFQVVGLDPEPMSLVLSFAATAALFVITVRFLWVRLPHGRKWIAVLPALFLASTRSFAVWASSGLETRLFDLLLAAGVLRLVHELEAATSEPRPDGSRAPRAWSPWIFGLAALTRPDGVLVGGCAFLASIAYLRWTTGRMPWRFALAWWPMGALVGAHLLFRLAYYGDWVPNTFYAKVGSRRLWGQGARYLALFALEYGVLLWIPGIVAGILAHARARTLALPAVAAATVLPHVLYVVAIGGDHFEFRPFDFIWPLAFLLIASGIGVWSSSARRSAAAASYAALVLFGLAWFPLRSHREFPKEYWPGFPGTYADKLPDADRYLKPEEDPVLGRTPLLAVARAYRDLVREQTANFGAIRQEEHRMFLASADAAARRLTRMLDQGILPRDLYIAVDCVGVVPYRTDLRTLDRLGLTDAHVAHGPFVHTGVAHGKYATIEYGRERGVDVWSADPVSPVLPVGHNRLERAIRRALAEGGGYYSADLGAGNFLFCVFPQGVEHARTRLPGVGLRLLQDSTIVASYVRQVMPGFLSDLEHGRVDPRRVQRLGEICALQSDLKSAETIYEVATRTYPNAWQFHWMLAICRKLSGDVPGATPALLRAIEIQQAAGDTAAQERLPALFDQIRPGMSLRELAGRGSEEE